MKKLILLGFILMGLILASCDSREDVFAKWNEDPLITLFKNGEEMMVLRDTVKMGYPLSINYTVQDEEIIKLQYEENSSLSVTIKEGDKRIEIRGIEEGEKELNLFCVDAFGRKASVVIELYSFLNMIPVASLKLEKITGLEVDIDARGSYDPDARFGGGILLYEYNVQGITNQSGSSRIKFVYGSSGTKTVKLRVMDNNNVWSSWVTEYIVL
jgi:hypothetical protein